MNYDYLGVITITFLVTQLLKVMIDLFLGKFHWSSIFHYGGMPSAHTATVVALLTIITINNGIASPLFAISFLFGAMVIADAIGIRRFLSGNAEALAKVISEEELPPMKLYLHFGHTPFQALIGGLIGLAIALIYANII